MTDIYDIKDIILGLPFNPFFTTIILLIFVLLYIFIFKKKRSNIILRTEVIIDKEKNYNEIFIWKDFLSMPSKKFLKEISNFFREYLEDNLKIDDFSKLTLKEIKNLEIEKNYKDLIENVYFKEYKDEEIKEEDKKNIYEEIKKIVIKDKQDENI